MERYWFRTRRYGYGAIVTVVVAGAAFIALCVAKGEPPGWRWGRRD